MKVKNSIHFYFLPFLTFCFRHKTSASCFLKSMFHLTQTLFLSSPNNLMLQSASGQSHDVKSKQSWVLNKSWSPIKNVCTWLEFHNPRKVCYLGGREQISTFICLDLLYFLPLKNYHTLSDRVKLASLFQYYWSFWDFFKGFLSSILPFMKCSNIFEESKLLWEKNGSFCIYFVIVTKVHLNIIILILQMKCWDSFQLEKTRNILKSLSTKSKSKSSSES